MSFGRSPEHEQPRRRRTAPWTWRLATSGRSRGRRWALGAAVAGLALLSVVGVGERELAGDRSSPALGLLEPAALAAVRVSEASPTLRAELLARAADVWSEHEGEASLDVVLAPEDLAWLRAQDVALEVLVPDVQALAAAERERLESPAAAKPPTPGEWFTEYRDLSTIHAHLDDLAALRPELASTETIGTSLEGRPLRAIRIRGRGERPKGILVDAGLHAREWISMMVGTCIADRLVRGYDHDERLRRFVDSTELVIVPVANPDGYVHSWRRDRYWRKNRRDGHGVDLNRNFGLAWGGEGSSGSRSSQVYRGAAPFSEPESEALRRLVDTGTFAAHVDLHSYGQLLLHPWSHTRERSREHAKLAAIAERMVSAIAEEHGERYRPMSGESLYPASGTMLDWAHGTHGMASFVIELRPRGGTGFVLPPDQIVPTCDEGLAAVLALGEAVAAAADAL
jgi:predicted deacylase